MAGGLAQLLQIGCALVLLATPMAIGADLLVGEAEYARDVLPVLRRYCGECHGRGTSEDRWSFDGYNTYGDLLADQKSWGKAQQFIASHIMPPHGEPAPSAAQRRILLDWIDNAVYYVDPSRSDPGPSVLRRLNRAEYNNSVRDVLGIESRPADQFPADDAGYGFDNIAEVLTVSPLHFEKYLAAAREVAEEATRLEQPPRVGRELTGDNLTVFAGKPEELEKILLLRSPADETGTTIRIPVKSVYRVLTRAATTVEQPERLASLQVLCDGEPIGQLQPTAAWNGKPGPVSTVFALLELPAGEHRIALRLKSAAIQDALPDQVAAIAFLGISGPFTPMPPWPPELLQHAAPSRALGMPILRLSGEDLDTGSGRSSLDTGRAWFSSTGYRRVPLYLSQAGKYRLRFKVGAQQAGQEQVKFEIRLADQTLGPFTVTAGSQVEQWVETQCELPAGQYDWQVWFINEFKDPQTGAERWFWLHEFSIEGPLDGDYGITRTEAIELVNQTGRRLFRRPLTTEEAAKLLHLLDSVIAGGETPQAAVRVALETLLVSPKFLYHPQPKPAGESSNGTVLIDEFALASRLSYFLWSSTPDEELLTLAERGDLRSQLAAQVRRMIRDSRIDGLTANFAGQWLQLRNLDQVTPDTASFPEFDASLAADMRRESELLFAHILQGNRSVLDFLDADYTFVNPRLAKHYGLPMPPDEGFHRVSLLDSPRRGVLTHGSVLTLTSLPTRTSPVKRGKWLLEQILGTQPPPPPADVPPLTEARDNEALPLRARLEQHRANPACASCHALLDPLGFALENYDAIGRWRTRDGAHAIDASGSLITGERFSDATELRALLVSQRRDDFLRCFTEHLLTYALGRGVTWQDKLAVRGILEQSEPANYRFGDLILDVCESVPIQRMRISATAATINRSPK